MGVPAFFRWLSRKYPSVIIECVEKKEEDASAPNPNGVEFDNLYLDMNGIIHPCTHPEDKPAPKNEDEMMVAIFECIDRLFNIVRPRKVLYMAIDGVAPRAKMNQQRSRRFRASKESAEKAVELARIREELVERGCVLPPQVPKGEVFDSNCITPGTPFMDKLSKCLQYYVHDRLNNCPAWKGIKVVLSDANVPGEGEHKIMDYIRKQRAQPNHDPNTQHVLCGADADLIMLGLATHEPNFTIIREEFLPNKPRPCEICSLFGHEAKDCNGLDLTGADTAASDQMQLCKETNFIFVRLCVLKEYLERELEMPNLPFTYEFERVIDDWVFLCFFVGNDFLPHLPSLEIREGAIDRLVNLYKKCVYKTGGYLTDSGEVALERVEMIMVDLGYLEDEIFKDRQKTELRFRESAKRRKLQEQRNKPDYKAMFNTQFMPTALGSGAAPAALSNVRQEAAEIRKREMDKQSPGQKRKAEEPVEKPEEDPEANDEVRLWENGFKDRYYQSKFDVEPDDLQFRNTVALEYVRGLCWVLKYYYQGCVSWSWYFPYHYAPFASDFLNVSGLGMKFDRGDPFFPLEQLMGVFPAASKKHVPDVFGKLMDDPNSPIIDFYPEDFKIDLNGKKFAWQGVALLPFVDEKRLFKALLPVKSELSEEEINRNKTGDDRLFIGPGCSAYTSLTEFYKDPVLNELDTVIDGVKCTILKSQENIGTNGTLYSPLKTHSEINNNNVITVLFRNPFYGENYNFLANVLEGAVRAPRILKGQDNQSQNYRPKMGFGNYNQQASLSQAGGRMLNHHMPDAYQSFQRNSYPSSQQQGGYSSHNNQGNSRYGGNQQRNSYGGSQYGESRANYGGDSRNNYGDQRGGNNRYQGRGGGPVHNPNTGRNYDNNRRDNRQNPYPSQQGRYNNRR